MSGERVFRSVVLIGLAMGGCDRKSAPSSTPEPAPRADAPTASAPRVPDGAAQPEPTAEAQPTVESDLAAEHQDGCPEGSEMPDPPCFYIL